MHITYYIHVRVTPQLLLIYSAAFTKVGKGEKQVFVEIKWCDGGMKPPSKSLGT